MNYQKPKIMTKNKHYTQTSPDYMQQLFFKIGPTNVYTDMVFEIVDCMI